ncbi:hypothetical protein ACF1FC_05325 [Streptomyces sp. NPDC014344]|uniref:hypothetical protein n=2 Tax=Streptomyces TaxID=1883 RepID=UPI0036F947FA
MRHFRFLGTDRATGKDIYADPAPGGALERMADKTALETAAVLVALVGEVLEGGAASEAELGAFVPPLHGALAELTQVTARLLED